MRSHDLTDVLSSAIEKLLPRTFFSVLGVVGCLLPASMGREADESVEQIAIDESWLVGVTLY